MISDVLKGAVSDMEELEREYPMLYEPVRGDIENLKNQMLALAAKLNAPPPVLPVALVEGIVIGNREAPAEG